MSEHATKNDAVLKHDASTSTGDRYLAFSLGEEEFAMPLLRVREVIAMPDVTPIPQTPAYFLGIMNLRGQVISVLDLRQKLGIKSKNTTETAVIVCDFSPLSIGVVVDTVNSVLTPKAEDISDKPEVDKGVASEYILGVYRREKSLVLLLDVLKTLNLDDKKAVTKMASAATKKAA